MSSNFPRFVVAALFCVASLSCFAQKPITFCADPENPPFSTREKSGFENKIALALGAELHRPVEFHWSRLGRGFIREVMNKGACDAFAAVPVGMRGVLVTTPYFRSTYVFVNRTGQKPITSLDDPRLRNMKIGVQVLDDDYAPPALALSRRGLTKNVVGFDMEGGASSIVSAVVKGKIDTAIVWGPLAGFYAKPFSSKVKLSPVTPEVDPPKLPFTFEMGVGVRKNEPELHAQLNEALRRAQPQIERILRQYNAPLLPMKTNSEERVALQ